MYTISIAYYTYVIILKADNKIYISVENDIPGPNVQRTERAGNRPYSRCK